MKHLIYIVASTLVIAGVNPALARYDGFSTVTKEAPWIGDTLTNTACVGKPTVFGPYDYNDRDTYYKELGLVEGAHFNYKVEQLQEGALSKHNLYGDIDYTLRAFPNHHRALNTIIRFRMLHGSYQRADLQQPECYLQRALNFAPEDATTHMLYAMYMHKLDRFDDALSKYEKALSLSPNNIEIQYNLALLLTEMKRFEEAKKYAVNVYAKKYPLQGLKKKLKAAGHW